MLKQHNMIDIAVIVIRNIVGFAISIAILALIIGHFYEERITEQNAQLNRIEQKLDDIIIMQKMDLGVYEEGIDKNE